MRVFVVLEWDIEDNALASVALELSVRDYVALGFALIRPLPYVVRCASGRCSQKGSDKICVSDIQKTSVFFNYSRYRDST